MKANFLSAEDRIYLRRYINRRKADGLCVRRANALLALDKGRSFADVRDFLEIGASTLRGWVSAYETHGVDFLEMKDYTPHINKWLQICNRNSVKRV